MSCSCKPLVPGKRRMSFQQSVVNIHEFKPIGVYTGSTVCLFSKHHISSIVRSLKCSTIISVNSVNDLYILLYMPGLVYFCHYVSMTRVTTNCFGDISSSRITVHTHAYDYCLHKCVIQSKGRVSTDTRVNKRGKYKINISCNQ